MKVKIRGQISVEYLIVVAFVVFLIILIMGVAFFYVAGIRDMIRSNQISNFADKVISNAESVFFAGEPSKVTINVYLPSGVNEVSINEMRELVINYSGDGGNSIVAFQSDVPMQGTFSNFKGIKRLEIVASESVVSINET